MIERKGYASIQLIFEQNPPSLESVQDTGGFSSYLSLFSVITFGIEKIEVPQASNASFRFTHPKRTKFQIHDNLPEESS